MINLGGKTMSEGLIAEIEAAGHSIVAEVAEGVRTWHSDDDVAVQAIVDVHDPLPAYKADAIAAVKAEGLSRMAAVEPAIKDFDTLSLVRTIWLSIAPAARQPTASMQSLIDIYTAGSNAISDINAATSEAEVDAVTPSWP